MVDREVALNNLMAAWKDTGLTFTLPPPMLTPRPDTSPAASASTSVSSAEVGGRTSESDDEGVDEGYANHPHRDPVMDALMGIRRSKKGKKSKAPAVSLLATGGAVAAAPPAAVGAAPAVTPAPPAPKPRGRRPKAPIDAQSQNDVRAIALVEGLTMLGRSDTESKRKVLPSGKPTPVVVGKWGYVETEDLAAKMRRTQEYAPRAARPPIICESVKQYRTASR